MECERTRLVALPDEAELVTEAALHDAVQAVVAQVRPAACEPRYVHRTLTHVDVAVHVLVHPLRCHVSTCVLVWPNQLTVKILQAHVVPIRKHVLQRHMRTLLLTEATLTLRQ